LSWFWSLDSFVSILADLKRFAELVTTQDGARVSITFRFESGASDLDNRALRDLDRLSDYWKAAKAKKPDMKLVVLGFADSIGSSSVNRRLSQQRADAVAKGLAQRSLTPDVIDGLGELAPVACDDTDSGRSKNRRVEVWTF
jgi:phosphate transport system substrate-binding protein